MRFNRKFPELPEIVVSASSRSSLARLFIRFFVIMSFSMNLFHYKQHDYRRKVILKACFQAGAAAFKLGQEQMASKEKTRKKARQPRSCWVRNWILDRPLFGQYEQLLSILRETDPKAFKIFQRLTPELWNEVYEKVSPRIERKTTCMREPISAGHRLAITLRYLATGDSYKTQMFGFRVASNTISGIVPDTCLALYEVLAPEYFKVNT